MTDPGGRRMRTGEIVSILAGAAITGFRSSPLSVMRGLDRDLHSLGERAALIEGLLRGSRTLSGDEA